MWHYNICFHGDDDLLHDELKIITWIQNMTLGDSLYVIRKTLMNRVTTQRF